MPAVLVADDHEDSRAVLRAMLEFRGSRVLEAEDGLECVRVARAEHPDIIVLDLLLPRMDGWEAARVLQADPGTSAIPVIAYTASALPTDHERARSAGCDLVVVKPAEPARLAALIERLHAEHEALRHRFAALREDAATLRRLARAAVAETEQVLGLIEASRAAAERARSAVTRGAPLPEGGGS